MIKKLNDIEEEKLMVWEVRTTGLPKIFVEAWNKRNAEMLYRQKFNLVRKDLIFAEVSLCQPMLIESKRR